MKKIINEKKNIQEVEIYADYGLIFFIADDVLRLDDFYLWGCFYAYERDCVDSAMIDIFCSRYCYVLGFFFIPFYGFSYTLTYSAARMIGLELGFVSAFFWTFSFTFSLTLLYKSSSIPMIVSPTCSPVYSFSISALICCSPCLSDSKSLLKVIRMMDPETLPMGKRLLGSWITLYSLSTKVTPSPVILPTVKAYSY